MEGNPITHEEHHSGQFTSSPNLHLKVSSFWDERRDAELSHPF